MIAEPPGIEPGAEPPPRVRSPRALLAGGAAAVRSLRPRLVAGERLSVASELTASGGELRRMVVASVAAAIFLLAVAAALFLR